MVVMTNPSAGASLRKAPVRELVEHLKQRGLAPEVITNLRALDSLVERYRAAGQLRAVVAAGGDGTVAEIVNRTEPGVPVTVFPLGTANLLANYFRISGDPAAMAEVLAEGHTARFDAGRANGRVFLLMTGCGFDAEVVDRLHRKRTGRHISYWTYARPILEAIRSYEYPQLNVHCELAPGNGPSSAEFVARWAFAVNLPCYAGGLQVAPRAVATDGLLDVCTFGRGSLWQGLRYLGYVALASHQRLADCKMAMVQRVRIESTKPVPYQLDGDPGGQLPLDIDVLPERLTIMAGGKRLAALQPAAPGSLASSGALEQDRA